jgi:hypothetical protein
MQKATLNNNWSFPRITYAVVDERISLFMPYDVYIGIRIRKKKNDWPIKFLNNDTKRMEHTLYFVLQEFNFNFKTWNFQGENDWNLVHEHFKTILNAILKCVLQDFRTMFIGPIHFPWRAEESAAALSE